MTSPDVQPDQSPADHKEVPEVVLDPRVAVLRSEIEDPVAKEAAFSSIVTEFGGQLKGDATRMVGPDRAEDVVQDTFLKAYLAMGRFKGESEKDLAKWLTTIARNRARNVIRDTARADAELAKSNQLATDSLEPLAIINQPSRIGDPVARQEFRDDISSLQGMAPSQYEILRLRAAGLSPGEISERLDLSPGSTKAGIGRARQNARIRVAKASVLPDTKNKDKSEAEVETDSETLVMV